MSVTLYGASDDLIEVEGDVYEEFNTESLSEPDEGVLFSNGLVARIRYINGVWRINIVLPENRDYKLITAEELAAEDPDDNDYYSDVLTVNGDIDWVFCTGRTEYRRDYEDV